MGPDWAALCKVKGDGRPAPLGGRAPRPCPPVGGRPGPPSPDGGAAAEPALEVSPESSREMKEQVLCAQERGPGWQGYDYWEAEPLGSKFPVITLQDIICWPCLNWACRADTLKGRAQPLLCKEVVEEVCWLRTTSQPCLLFFSHLGEPCSCVFLR